MSKVCLWVPFQAQPIVSVESERLTPDQNGVFFCLESQPDPEHLLRQVLMDRGLDLTSISEGLALSMDADWTASEHLKQIVEEKGHALSFLNLPGMEPFLT